MSEPEWHELGPVDGFKDRPLTEVKIDRLRLAITYHDDTIGAVSGVCNHVGGPLAKGTIAENGYVVCPWHYWKFHHVTGLGEPGYEDDAVPHHKVKVEGGVLFVDLHPASARTHRDKPKHALARTPARQDGPLRVVGISTTAMDTEHPRVSTSDTLLCDALDHARDSGADTRLIRLNDLSFRSCEGFYSKSKWACTWPCSITQMDQEDQLEAVYEAFVHWADVILVATPIRWGAASALYFKMVERMNCVQNQITLHDTVLMRNKVASFIITGGQDNVQAVAGQMLTFFGELGCHFPPFPFIGHSRGWTAEDMERNVAYVMESQELRLAGRGLVDRALELAHTLVDHGEIHPKTERRGRKGSGIVERAPAGVAQPKPQTGER